MDVNSQYMLSRDGSLHKFLQRGWSHSARGPPESMCAVKNWLVNGIELTFSYLIAPPDPFPSSPWRRDPCQEFSSATTPT